MFSSSNWLVQEIESKISEVKNNPKLWIHDDKKFHNKDCIQPIADLIKVQKKKITDEDFAAILEFFYSKKDYDIFLSDVLTRFEINPRITSSIQSSLANCVANKNIKAAEIFVRYCIKHSIKLTSDSLAALLFTFGNHFRHDIIKFIEQSEDKIVNVPTVMGVTLTELAVIKKDYRLALECASHGGDFKRILQASPVTLGSLSPSFFCHRNHNNMALQIRINQAQTASFNNAEFKPLFDDIMNNQFKESALTLLAKLANFKQRILDYIGTLEPQVQQSLLESASQVNSPLYIIFNTSLGHWRSPSISHGFQKKILQKLVSLEEIKKTNTGQSFFPAPTAPSYINNDGAPGLNLPTSLTA